MIKFNDMQKIQNDLKAENWDKVIVDILNILISYNLSTEDWMKDIITSKDNEYKKELVNKWLIDLNSLHGIKQIREAQGYSQLELAEKIGRDQRTISKWESGVNSPRTEALVKIAEVLNCDINDLI